MYKVIKRFRDKNTKQIFEVGCEYKSKDENRLKMLTEKGFLEFVEKEEKPKKTKSVKKTDKTKAVE